MRSTFRILCAAALLCAVAPAAAAQEPQVAELQPARVVTGSGDFTLVIRGSGFIPGVSRVSFGGRNLRDARVTATSITVPVANQLITERVEDDFGDDGIARVPVTVLNGPASDAPRDSRILYVTRANAVAPVRAPAPVLAGLGPSPVPVDGTLVITGQHFDAPSLSVTLLSSDPAARSSSYNRDRYLSRSATEVRVPLAGVPAGSYTVRVEAFDADRRALGTIERAVVVGSPTRLGPPTIARYGPTPVRRGTNLWIDGTNFADDAQVHLVGAGATAIRLARTPNARSSQTRLYVTVPANLPPGDFTVRVTNPGAGTPPAQVAVAIQHPAQPTTPGRPGGSELDGTGGTPARPAPGRPRPRPAPGRPGGAPSSPAYTLAITAGSLCLTPDADRDGAPVRLRPCTEGGAMFRIENGYVATASGRCLDWGEAGGAIHLMPCKDGRPERSSQQWYFHGNKLVQNALRDDICMDVQGERIQAGTPVIAYACRDYRTPPPHQRFYPGGRYSLLNLPPGIRSALQRASASRPDGAGWVLMSDGSRVISAGSGNVISAGGGNVISAGSGNVVSAGSGNVVSAGGLNLRVVSDPAQLLQGARVISAGSGNVISAGGLN